VIDGQITSFADIDCDAIRAVIADSLIAMPPARRDLYYGRALGRVVGHELYHIIMGEAKHARTGLARACLTAEELMAESLHFGRQEVGRLRATLIPVLLSAYTWPSRSEQRSARVFMAKGCGSCHGPLGEGTRLGPPLRTTHTYLEVSALASRLNRSDTLMYRHARKLDMLWPTLDEGDIQDLANYVNAIRSWKRASNNAP
jgi:cytochrome c553